MKRRRPRGWVEHSGFGQRLEWTRTVGNYRIDFYPVSGAGLVTPLDGARERGFTFTCTAAGLVYRGVVIATRGVLDALDRLEDAVAA